MPKTQPGNSQACGLSAWLQQRLVQRERLQCLLRWPRRAPCQGLFSSEAWPSSHRLLCEAVGRRPLLPAVFSYPSDIQLFLREEACLWQLLDLDSGKLCLTAFLFVSNQPAGQYHFLPGCISPPAALTLSLLLLSPYCSELTPAWEEDTGHISRSLVLPDRPKHQLGPTKFPVSRNVSLT